MIDKQEVKRCPLRRGFFGGMKKCIGSSCGMWTILYDSQQGPTGKCAPAWEVQLGALIKDELLTTRQFLITHIMGEQPPEKQKKASAVRKRKSLKDSKN